MKNLLRNYIDNLTNDKIMKFALQNDINLNIEEANYLLDLVKNNFEDILIDENKYFDLLNKKLDYNKVNKIKELFLYYKNRYKGYLF